MKKKAMVRVSYGLFYGIIKSGNVICVQTITYDYKNPIIILTAGIWIRDNISYVLSFALLYSNLIAYQTIYI